jgi:nucleoside-diphosphate-sugar epimerase
MTMSYKTVLVTGANGYIGNAVAKAFSRAGWKTFGLIRSREDAAELAMDEIHPIIGSPVDLSFLDQTGDTVFDVVVSNTEPRLDPATHFEKVQTVLHEVARRSQQSGVRPLIMFTSGCKDYGAMAQKHGDPGLAPHMESSPINPPEALLPRSNFGVAWLEGSDGSYDATVLRPTIVYGHSSSYYGTLFELAAKSKSVLQLLGDPSAIMHSLHVDDCADAYVALAEHSKRAEVAQQAFNISNKMYETAREIGEALAKSYGLTVEFVAPPEDLPFYSVHALANFWQWVSSDKLRALTGWSERKSTFVKGIEEYRLAYEARRQV